MKNRKGLKIKIKQKTNKNAKKRDKIHLKLLKDSKTSK